MPKAKAREVPDCSKATMEFLEKFHSYPQFQDGFVSECTTRNIGKDVKYFNPLNDECKKLIRVNRTKGKWIRTLNIANVIQKYGATDPNAVFLPADDVPDWVFNQLRLLWVNCTRRRDRVNPLMMAAHLGKLKCVQLLIKFGASTNWRLYNGNTVLVETIASDTPAKFEIVRELLDSGANYQLPNKNGHNALTVAAWVGDPEVFDLLLTKRFVYSLDLRTVAGTSALTLAVIGKHWHIIKFLANHPRCDISVEDKMHLSAVGWGQTDNHKAVTHLMIRLGLQGKLRAFTTRCLELVTMESRPEHDYLFKVVYHLVRLLLVLRPSRWTLVDADGLETLMNHKYWYHLNRRDITETYVGLHLLMWFLPWMKALSCGILHEEDTAVARFLKSKAADTLLKGLELVGNSEPWVMSKEQLDSVLLPVLGSERGRKWIVDTAFKKEGVLKYFSESSDNSDDIEKDIKAYCDILESPMVGYNLKEVRASTEFLGEDLRNILPPQKITMKQQTEMLIEKYRELIKVAREILADRQMQELLREETMAQEKKEKRKEKKKMRHERKKIAEERKKNRINGIHPDVEIAYGDPQCELAKAALAEPNQCGKLTKEPGKSPQNKKHNNNLNINVSDDENEPIDGGNQDEHVVKDIVECHKNKDFMIPMTRRQKRNMKRKEYEEVVRPGPHGDVDNSLKKVNINLTEEKGEEKVTNNHTNINNLTVRPLMSLDTPTVLLPKFKLEKSYAKAVKPSKPNRPNKVIPPRFMPVITTGHMNQIKWSDGTVEPNINQNTLTNDAPNEKVENDGHETRKNEQKQAGQLQNQSILPTVSEEVSEAKQYINDCNILPNKNSDVANKNVDSTSKGDTEDVMTTAFKALKILQNTVQNSELMQKFQANNPEKMKEMLGGDVKAFLAHILCNGEEAKTLTPDDNVQEVTLVPNVVVGDQNKKDVEQKGADILVHQEKQETLEQQEKTVGATADMPILQEGTKQPRTPPGFDTTVPTKVNIPVPAFQESSPPTHQTLGLNLGDLQMDKTIIPRVPSGAMLVETLEKEEMPTVKQGQPLQHVQPPQNVQPPQGYPNNPKDNTEMNFTSEVSPESGIYSPTNTSNGDVSGKKSGNQEEEGLEEPTPEHFPAFHDIPLAGLYNLHFPQQYFPVTRPQFAQNIGPPPHQKWTAPSLPTPVPPQVPLLWTKRSKKWEHLFVHLVGMNPVDRQKIGSLNFSFKDDKLFLAKGSNGTVVTVGLRDDGMEVAVKRMLKYNSRFIKNELHNLQLPELDHPNIVKYRDYVEDAHFAYLALELCEYTLDQYIHRLKAEGSLEGHAKRLVWQLMTGLEVLHAAKVLHMDLKPRNVLIDTRGNVRLADFGLSRRLEEGENTFYQSAIQGTRCWRPKESLCQLQPGESAPYKPVSDVQVAGMIAHYIVTGGEHPYGTDAATCEMNIRYGYPSLTHVTDELCLSLLCWMLHPQMEKRKSATECLRHPYFWNASRCYYFLRRVSNEPEMKLGVPCQLTKDLEKMKDWIGCSDWPSQIEPALLSHPLLCWKGGGSVPDLLRFMYQVEEHFDSLSPELRELIGDPAKYFLQVFPRVFSILYDLLRDSEWRQRRTLRDFYEAKHFDNDEIWM